MKYNKRQLNNIKSNFSNTNSKSLSRNLRKQIIKNLKSNDDTESENEDTTKITRRDIKQKSKKDKTICIEWNVNVGDIVEWKTSRDSEDTDIGIVVEMQDLNKYSSMNLALSYSQALVMSEKGRFWINLKSLVRIDEE